MVARTPSNPLALAVLSLLVEREMHPYEMSRCLRERNKEQSIKLNYGSLYSVVDQLHRHHAIEPTETEREGRRPERTVYRITDAGRAKFEGWLSDLLRKPLKEYPKFEAGLSLMSGLPVDTVVSLLEERVARLRGMTADWRATFAELHGQLPRLYWIEHEYEITQAEAELAFVEKLLAEIKNGTLEGLDLWRGDKDAERQWSEAIQRLQEQRGVHQEREQED